MTKWYGEFNLHSNMDRLKPSGKDEVDMTKSDLHSNMDRLKHAVRATQETV